MIRLFSTLFFCLACVGCATKKYSVPAGVETAQFVMAVNIERFGTTGYTTVKALTEQCKKNEDGEEISEAVTIDEESMDISIKLEYESYIKEFIQKQKYENEGFKNGILNEYDEIIRIYTENYKSKVD